jgi:hypothetical protein
MIYRLAELATSAHSASALFLALGARQARMRSFLIAFDVPESFRSWFCICLGRLRCGGLSATRLEQFLDFHT